MKINVNNKIHLNSIQLVVFSLGVLLILSVIGYLSYKAVKMDDKPPHPEVTTEYLPDQTDYTYRVKIKNKGEETATNLTLKMTLYQDGKEKESGSFSINYLPIQSEQVGWIIFDTTRKPTDSLVVTSITYLRP